ncbi:MAG: hypothetical protein GY829_06280 [Gammaproteobacteria bacterium]|nr:hypothetical protein [Gammaproteobacteria bacterium]
MSLLSPDPEFQTFEAPANPTQEIGELSDFYKKKNFAPNTTPTPVKYAEPKGDYSRMDKSLLNKVNAMEDTGSNARKNIYEDKTKFSDDLKDLNVTKNANLLSDRMSGILDEGSPLMDRAKTVANQEMAKRGLLNSSIGVGATQSALTDQAYKIAAGDVDVDKFNAGEENKMQSQLMGSEANLSSQAMNNLGSTYNTTQSDQNDLLKDTNKADLDMEHTMLQYTNERAIEMLKQQSGLYAQYLNAYSSIASSDIPASQKNAQLENLGKNIDAAVNAANRYSDLVITNAPGGFSFDPVNGENASAGSSTISDLNASDTSQTDSSSLLQQDVEEMNIKVNDIYNQVRVGGGDSPEESLIDDFRQAMDVVKSSPYELDRIMRIYSENGMNNDNWEDTINKMITASQPYVDEQRKAAAARTSWYGGGGDGV